MSVFFPNQAEMIKIQYRKLGKTGLKVSSLGLGIEHLKNKPIQEITNVLETAIEYGVNYFDLVWSLPNVIQGVSKAITNKDVHLAVHLGSSFRNGKYVKVKGVKRCEETFRETLDRLGKDCVSIINLHYVKNMKEWKRVSKPKGVLDLAIRLRDEGLGKGIALSTHELEVVRKAAVHSEIASVMYQVNLANHLLPGRDEALSYCASNGVGIVAMKPFAAGNLLKPGKKVKFPEYKTGGLRTELRIPSSLSEFKCLHYSLSQIGVCCVVFGAKTVQELKRNLEYHSMGINELDYNKEISLLTT
jgi:predicted aldo/keto reductase-like oxidoreductase